MLFYSLASIVVRAACAVKKAGWYFLRRKTEKKKKKNFIYSFSTGFSQNLTWTNLIHQDNEEKIHEARESARFRCSVSACGLRAPTHFFFTWGDLDGLLQGRWERRGAAGCVAGQTFRNAVKCLYPQRQLGSLGSLPALLKAVFVLKTLGGFLIF